MRRIVKGPCYQTIMPYAAAALKKLGGNTTKQRVLYQLMLDMDLPTNAFEKVKKELGWAGSRLRALGIIKEVEKRGIWELEEEFFDLEEENLKQVVKEKHKAALN